ncbi:aldehyde dehydrogenase family protein, partial [Geobacillus sp. MMMUD3]|nr:aldehyde dehydrogenase family protein [Geobacillus sp. MMMUD3]
AAEAYETWRHVAPADRARLLRRFAAAVDSAIDELAALEVANAGHTISNATWEAGNVRDVIEYYAAVPERLFGRQIPVAGGVDITFHEPLGVVGVISAFNFPVAVYSWNTALALVAGDAVVWKPSENAVLAALGAQSLLARAAAEVGAPEGLVPVLIGGRDIGDAMVRDDRVALVSATGSVRM